MTHRLKLLAVTLLAAVAASSTGRAQTGNSRVFGDLLKRIPEQSNVLMLVNVDGLFDSPMGRRENWRQKAAANHGAGLGLAADVSKVAVAVGMDFHSMQERWKVGIVQLRRDVPVKLDDLAAREGGYVETIENTPVAWTPRRVLPLRLPRQRSSGSPPRPTARASSAGSGRPSGTPATSPRAGPTGPSSGPTPAPRSSWRSTWPTPSRPRWSSPGSTRST